MSKGTVKWFNDAKGYGFIQVEQGKQDIFVHQTEIRVNGYRTLVEGAHVEFEEVPGPKGPKAANVRLIA